MQNTRWEHNSPLGILQVPSYFTETEVSVPCPQETATGPYPEPDESSLHPHALLFKIYFSLFSFLEDILTVKVHGWVRVCQDVSSLSFRPVFTKLVWMSCQWMRPRAFLFNILQSVLSTRRRREIVTWNWHSRQLFLDHKFVCGNGSWKTRTHKQTALLHSFSPYISVTITNVVEVWLPSDWTISVKVTLPLTVIQSVSYGVQPLGPMTRYLLRFDIYVLFFCVGGRPLWQEDGSVFCICCWPSPA
jgi:hypothetical protein